MGKRLTNEVIESVIVDIENGEKLGQIMIDHDIALTSVKRIKNLIPLIESEDINGMYELLNNNGLTVPLVNYGKSVVEKRRALAKALKDEACVQVEMPMFEELVVEDNGVAQELQNLVRSNWAIQKQLMKIAEQLQSISEKM